MVDYNALFAAIEDSGLKRSALAKKSGISRPTLYNKLAGKSEFTVKEIDGICVALNLTKTARDRIFFAK